MDNVRKVIAYRGEPTKTGNSGYLNVIMCSINDEFCAIDDDNFCVTQKVFVRNFFDTIPVGKILKVDVTHSTNTSENLPKEFACKYVAKLIASNEISFELVKPKDLTQIIKNELPDCDDKKIFVRELPVTEYIFLNSMKQKECMFGPFSFSSEKIVSGFLLSLNWNDAKFLGRSFKKDVICKFDYKQIEHLIVEYRTSNDDYVDIINNTNDELKSINPIDYIDYISNKDLIDFGLRFLHSLSNSTSSLKSISAALKTTNFQNILNDKLKQIKDQNELKRYQMFFSLFSDNNKDINELFSQSDKLREIIQNELITYPERYNVVHQNNDLEDAIQELDEIKNEINQFQEEKNHLIGEIKKLNDEKSKFERLDNKNNELTQKNNELESAYKAKEEELIRGIENKNTEFHEITKKLHLAKDVEKLQDHKTYLEKNSKELEDKKEKLEQECNQSNKQLMERLIGLKPYVDHINGSFITHDIQTKQISIENINVNNIDENSLIEHVQQMLQSKNRCLSKWQVLDLIICLQQSFMTIFAGLPGTGKTSLSRKFVEALGLKNRFHEVSVSRGWTSEKDLIGFKNPLTSQFQPSSTGLYEFLRAVSDESQDKNLQAPMAYVLLDEANLSPIEHYWSKFIGLADNEENIDRKIYIGDEVLNIPNNLKFIATINYDSTTEQLTPRIIDRVPVVVLDNLSKIDVQNIYKDILEVQSNLPISSEKMHELFGRAKSNQELFSTQEKEILRDIQTTLSTVNVYISPRKQLSMANYCHRARFIMAEESELFALDIAILRFVLPQLRGHGDKYIEMTNNLHNILVESSLVKSADYLGLMMSRADQDFQSIDFFCW